jgi:hypothetical protein
LIVCQNRLGDIGMGLKDYSHYHKGQFPSGSSLGNPQLAGILYVPILLRDGFVTNESSFICPASPSGTKAQPRMEYTSAKPPLQSGLDDLMQWGNKSYGFSLGYVCNGVHCGTKDLDRTYFALGSDVPSNDPANGRQSLNHGGTGQNVLFEDGMVRFVTSSWIIPQADDIYTNKYKLVAPGIDIDDSVIALPFVLLRY